MHLVLPRQSRRLGTAGWLLFGVSILIWLAALHGDQPPLKTLTLAVYLLGVGSLLAPALSHWSGAPLQAGLAILAAAQAVSLPFVAVRPGLKPVVFAYYGSAWFLYASLHTGLTVVLLLLARRVSTPHAAAWVDRPYPRLRGLVWIAAGWLVAGLGLILAGFGVFRFATANAFGLLWPLSVLPVSVAVIAALWLRRTDRIGWLLLAYSVPYWGLTLHYTLWNWASLAPVYYGLGLVLLWGPRLRVPVAPRLRNLHYFSIAFALLLPLGALRQSDAPDFLNYYTLVQAVTLGCQLVLVAGLTAIVLYRPQWVERSLLDAGSVRLSRLRTAFIGLASLSASLILLLAWRGTLTSEDVSLALVSVSVPLLALALLAGLHLHTAPRVLWERRVLLLVGVGTFSLASLGVSLISLRQFPNFATTDEPWTVCFSDTYNRTGYVYASMVPKGDIPSRSAPRIYILLNFWMNAWHRDLFAARSFSLLGGLALVGVVFATAREIGDTRAGLLAILLTVTNLMWLGVSHVARPEMWFAVAIWLAFWFSLVARRRRSGVLAALSGLVIALSSDIHSAGPLFCVILGVWWLSDWTALRSQRRILAWFVVGGLLGTAFYVSYHLLPDPESYWLDIQGQMSGQGGGQMIAPVAMIKRHVAYFQSNPIELIGLIAGSLVAVIRLPRTRRTGLFIGLILAVYAVLQSDPNIYYPMLWITGLIILTACALRSAAWQWQVPALILVLSTFGLNVLLIRGHVREDWNGQELTATRQVVERLPEEGTVIAHALFYFALRDPRLISYAYLETVQPDPAKQWPVIQQVNPLYIIDGPLRMLRLPQAHAVSFFPYMDMPTNYWEPDLIADYTIREVVHTEIGTFLIWQQRATLGS